MHKTYFFITTNGHSASRWLAQTLNTHPDIICSHSPARISIAMAYDHAYTDDEFKQIMADEGRKNVPVDRLLDELEKIEDVSCYGNVHLFNLRQLHENINETNPTKNITIIDLIRHPVSFVHSGTYNMIRQAQYNQDRLNYLQNIYFLNRELYEDFCSSRNKKIDNLESLSFMANVMTLKSLSFNMQIQDVDRRIKMEEIINDKVKYKELVYMISQGKIETNDHYLNSVFNTKVVNRHSMNKHVAGVEEIYNNWDDWKKEFFDLLVGMTNIDQYYALFGYDFSFLKYHK